MDPAKKVSTGADPAKKVSNGDHAVKAGYWFCTSEIPPEKINVDLFTHLYAGFALVNIPNANIDDVIKFPEQYSGILGSFPETVKQGNASVKALLSIGGEGPNISTAIASVVRDDKLRATFIRSSIKLAREHKYDGLDLCWLYPSNADQMDLFASLLKEWNEAVKEEADSQTDKEKLLLTAAVFHHPVIPVTDGRSIYPCQAISDYLNWINVLAMDFYTPFKPPANETGPVHGWLNPADTNRCGSAGIKNWIEEVATENVVLGLPFYGYKWTLRNHNDHRFFAPAHPANATTLEFRNIQAQYINRNIKSLVYDEDYVATYWYSEANTWIGFDNAESISVKIRKARADYNLGGYFAWHVGADDDISSLSTEASKAWDSAIYSDA